MGKFPGEGNGNPSQYSCLENPTDRGAWRATVHGITRVGHFVTKSPPPPFIRRTDAKAEAPIVWPSDTKSHLIGKDPDAVKH